MTHPSTQPRWKKSSKCETGACVEAADLGESIGVRNSTHPDGMITLFSKSQWADFVAGAKNGDFDF
jgi:hypothetical protein